MMTVTIEVNHLYNGTAKLAELTEYAAEVERLAGNGNAIILTGPGPVWLYLRIAHALHGKAMSLNYDSPVTGSVEIFNHCPW